MMKQKSPPKATRSTPHAILEALAAADGPLSVIDIADRVNRSDSAARAGLCSLLYADVAHWCGHQIDRDGPGRYRRIYASGPAPIDGLFHSPISPAGQQEKIRKSIETPLPIPRPALHPMLAWGVAA